MKKILLLLSIALVAGKCCAQTLTVDKIPAAAANAFKNKFPNGSQPGWSKESRDTYEVSFFNGKNDKARYSIMPVNG